MKKINNMRHYNISRLSILALALLGTACTFEQDDYFDESASLRITHLNERLQERLVAQSSGENNGWVMQYFVAGTDDANFEGFNILGSFNEKGKVTLASNHRFLRNSNAGKFTEHSSTYEMLTEEGPVLSFNSWNDILTVFVDPVDPSAAPNRIVSNGEGMNGDHNLVLKKFEDDEILFTGERHSAITRFIPCDRPWQQYFDDVARLKKKIATSTITNYYVINGTDTMYINGLNKGIYVYGERIYDPLKRKDVSCVFTPNGFRIEHEDTLGNSPFQEFVIDADSTCLLNEDGHVKVVACWDRYVATHTAIWELDASLFSAEQTSLSDQIDAEIRNFNTAWSLKSIGIGKSTAAGSVMGLVVTFYTNTAKTKTNTVGLALNMELTEYAKMKIGLPDADSYDKNMSSISAKATELPNLTKQFATTLAGSYTMTPDDYFNPTGCTFAASEGVPTFKLSNI